MAAFIGLSFEQQALDESPGILTYRFYAQFDGTQGKSGNDSVFGVADCGPGAPLVLNVRSGTFFQHPANVHEGGDLSPDAGLCEPDPTVCLDTFVTIGKLTAARDATQLAPGWPGSGRDSLEAVNSAWFVTPDDLQGTPGLADNPPDRVLLMQLSTTNGVGVFGALALGGFSDGRAFEDCLTFDTGCFVDIDGDNVVGSDDLLVVIEEWGSCPTPCAGDVTSNGTVGIRDLLEVLKHWGPCSTP